MGFAPSLGGLVNIRLPCLSMHMDIRQLRYFVTLAETRHFGRAAELLHIAQPALSQQIKQLENELQVELLDRSTRPVGLTSAGISLLREGREILSKVARAEALTRQESRKMAAASSSA
ncbi:LysR family transcriptional regulator [Paracoccus aerius]